MLSDYVCILSVVAQCAIDNAKRSFDIDIPKEIAIIKKALKPFGFPIYWEQVKINNDKRHNHGKKKKLTDKQKERFKTEIRCPMNCVYGLNIDTKSFTKTIPNSNFYVQHELEEGRRKSKKVEELIENYSLKVYISSKNFYEIDKDNDIGDVFLLRSDFEQLIIDIRNTYISGNYLGLMSWLINRAFIMTPEMKSNINTNMSKLNKNKSLLLKTLYIVNKDAFLKCFIKKC
jgi:hypothetical protein